MKRVYGLLAIALALFASVAQAQNPGTVTLNAYAIGKGPGVSGYSSLLCGSGQLAVGQSGAPVCRTVSGDATFSAGGALIFNTVNVNVGTFGDGTHVGQFTVDAKGRVTGASNVLVSGAPPTGAAGGALSGTYPNPLLATMLANTTLCNATAGVAVPTNCNAATMRTNIGVSATGADVTYNFRANNLNDVANAATARTNLGVTATGADTTYAFRANNLSDLASAATARTNLGLVIGTNVEAWDADLDCIAAISTTGVITRTGAGTCSAGTVAVADGGTGQITLTANAFLTGAGTSPVNQVVITGLVLGNGASAPSAYGGTSACSNQFMTALSAFGVATCTTPVLASAQFANQGTATTVLHGNAGGNPSFSAVSLTADVANILPIANGGTGTSAGAVVSVKTQKFTANDTYVPCTGMLFGIGEGWAGGGAGGGAVSSGVQSNAGGGGGAGGYARKRFTASDIGASKAVTIGAGGTGVSGANGNNGSDTSLGSLLIAKGGSGGSFGQFAGGGSGGAGGVAGTGDDTPAASGGASATASSTTAVQGSSGNGAGTSLGGGSGGVTGNSVTGTAGGTNTGGGGSGGANFNGGAQVPGGAGGSGYLRVTEFCSVP